VSISVSKLEKSYGSQKVLASLGFELPEGGRLAIFGRNGAGKTTLLRILAGLERPNSGTAKVAGFDVRKQADEVRQKTGLLSHNSLLYLDMSALENLVFYGRLYGVKDPEARALELLEMVGLSKRRFDAARTFSRGMAQRLSLARALVHDPKVLLLDEPYTGLDSLACAALDDLLGQMHGDCTMVMVDHERARCLDFSTHVLWLDPPIAELESGRKQRKAQPLFCLRDELLPEQEAAILGLSGTGMGAVR